MKLIVRRMIFKGLEGYLGASRLQLLQTLQSALGVVIIISLRTIVVEHFLVDHEFMGSVFRDLRAALRDVPRPVRKMAGVEEALPYATVVKNESAHSFGKAVVNFARVGPIFNGEFHYELVT